METVIRITTGKAKGSQMLKSLRKQIATGTTKLLMRQWMKKPIGMGMHMVRQTSMHMPLGKVMESLLLLPTKNLTGSMLTTLMHMLRRPVILRLLEGRRRRSWQLLDPKRQVYLLALSYILQP